MLLQKMFCKSIAVWHFLILKFAPLYSQVCFVCMQCKCRCSLCFFRLDLQGYLLLVFILSTVCMALVTLWLTPGENEMLVTAAQILSCVDATWMADVLLHLNSIFSSRLHWHLRGSSTATLLACLWIELRKHVELADLESKADECFSF